MRWYAFTSFLLFMLACFAITASASSPNIIIDGNFDDWFPSDWVCPGGSGCPNPSSDYTVWLCCNQTDPPRKCMLIWRDKKGDSTDQSDLIAFRLYLENDNIYLLLNVSGTIDSNRPYFGIWLNNTDTNENMYIRFMLYYDSLEEKVLTSDLDVYFYHGNQLSGETDMDALNDSLTYIVNGETYHIIETQISFTFDLANVNVLSSAHLIKIDYDQVDILDDAQADTNGDNLADKTIVELQTNSQEQIGSGYIDNTPLPIPENILLVKTSIIIALILGAILIKKIY